MPFFVLPLLRKRCPVQIKLRPLQHSCCNHHCFQDCTSFLFLLHLSPAHSSVLFHLQGFWFVRSGFDQLKTIQIGNLSRWICISVAGAKSLQSSFLARWFFHFVEKQPYSLGVVVPLSRVWELRQSSVFGSCLKNFLKDYIVNFFPLFSLSFSFEEMGLNKVSVRVLSANSEVSATQRQDEREKEKCDWFSHLRRVQLCANSFT